MEGSHPEEREFRSEVTVERWPLGSEHWIVHTSKTEVGGSTIHCVASQAYFSNADFGSVYEGSEVADFLRSLGVTQLRDLLEVEQSMFQFILESTHLVGSPNAVLSMILNTFPVPAFGSPPASWRSLSHTLATAGSGVVGNGLAVTSGRPVFAVATNVAVFVYWFGRPAARVTRRWFTELVAEKLEVSLQEDDYS